MLLVFLCVSDVVWERGVPSSGLPPVGHETVCESCMRAGLLLGLDFTGRVCVCVCGCAHVYLWFCALL